MENGRPGNGAEDHGAMKDPNDMRDAVCPPGVCPLEPGAAPPFLIDGTDGLDGIDGTYEGHGASGSAGGDLADGAGAAGGADGGRGVCGDIDGTGGPPHVPVRQDAFRSIVFGQIADGFFPPGQPPRHPKEATETTDDELARAALSHPIESEWEEAENREPTIWRAIFLTAVIVSVMAVLFCKPF